MKVYLDVESVIQELLSCSEIITLYQYCKVGLLLRTQVFGLHRALGSVRLSASGIAGFNGANGQLREAEARGPVRETQGIAVLCSGCRATADERAGRGYCHRHELPLDNVIKVQTPSPTVLFHILFLAKHPLLQSS